MLAMHVHAQTLRMCTLTHRRGTEAAVGEKRWGHQINSREVLRLRRGISRGGGRAHWHVKSAGGGEKGKQRRTRMCGMRRCGASGCGLPGFPGLPYTPPTPPQRGSTVWCRVASRVVKRISNMWLVHRIRWSTIVSMLRARHTRRKSTFRHNNIKSPSEMGWFGLCAAWLGGGADFTF